MTKLGLSALFCTLIASVAIAGTEYTGKEMRQTAVQPEECWYGDNEWNVSLWGTYAWTGTDSNTVGLNEFFFGENHGDRYIQTDHAWGGGIDAKYFWHKYFGFGVQGFLLDAKRLQFDYDEPLTGGFTFDKNTERRAIGSVLGTLTLRYPIGCSRFAPYVWAGGGGIFGGGERDVKVFDTTTGLFSTEHQDSESRLMGQFGGGVEVRITKHIGWINDFSWNVVDGPRNNFGMVRTGINFAF